MASSSQALKLERALESGDYYGALQLYRTVCKRKIDSKSFDEARELLLAGVQTLLRSGKAAEALDLADMLLKALLSAHAIPLTQAVTDALQGVISLVPPASAALGLRFAKAAIRWASKDSPVDPSGVDGSAAPSTAVVRRADGSAPPSPAELRHRGRLAQLHGAAARLAASAGPAFYADAQRHFLEADAPEEFAG